MVSSENSSERFDRLKQSDSLSKTQPESFEGLAEWLIWLPRIPHVGDIIQFPGWRTYVSQVELFPDFYSKDGLIETEHRVAAFIHICSDSNRSLSFITNDRILRGSVPDFYHWKLQHDDFDEPKTWHSRVRPYVGDCITVEGKPYQVISLELYDEVSFLDGIIHLKDT